MKKCLCLCVVIFMVMISIFPPVFGAGDDFFLEDGAQPAWSGKIETGLVFDDNILQEKDNKSSDTIWESSLFLNMQSGEAVFSALAVLNRYRKNTSLNNNFYELGISAPLSEKYYGSAFLNFSPSAPLDKEDADATPFELASQGFNLFIDREMPWGEMGVFVSWTRLDYNAVFDTKDSKIVALGPSLFYILDTRWTFSADLAFERGRAAGGTIFFRCPVLSEALLRACRDLLNDEGFTCLVALCTRGDDISFRATVFSVQTHYRFSPKAQLRSRYRVRDKRFTADEDDRIHHGRRDQNHLFFIEAVYKPYSKINLAAQIEKIWTRSSDPFVAFNEQRFSFSIAYYF